MIESLNVECSRFIQTTFCKKPSPIRSLLTIGLDILVISVFIALGHSNAWIKYLFIPLILAVVYFHHFSILHDCGHGSASNSKWANTILGHYCSIFCFLPFYPWQLIHQEHHKWSGVLDKDPVLKNLYKWKEAGSAPKIVNFAWLSWIPLAGFLQHFVFWLYPVKAYQDKKMSRMLFWQCFFSVSFMFFAHVLFLFFLWKLGWVIPVAISFFIYLILVELVNLPHHNALPNSKERLSFSQQYYISRSCYFPKPVSEALFLNFNFHIEHHLFPTAPWYTLRNIRQIVKEQLQDEYNESIGFRWNLDNRRKCFNDAIIVFEHK